MRQNSYFANPYSDRYGDYALTQASFLSDPSQSEHPGSHLLHPSPYRNFVAPNYHLSQVHHNFGPIRGDHFESSDVVIPRDSRRDREVRDDQIYFEEDDHAAAIKGSTGFTRPGGAFKSPALGQNPLQLSKKPAFVETKKFDVKQEPTKPEAKHPQVQFEFQMPDGLDDGEKSENPKSSQKPNHDDDGDEDNDDLFSEDKTLPTTAAGKELNKRDMNERDDDDDFDDDMQDSNDNDELFVEPDLRRTKKPPRRRS